MFQLNKEVLFAQLGYVPHEAQWAVHRSRAKRRVLIAGSRLGKSLCAAHEAIAFAMEPRKRAMIWIVAPTLELSDKVYREVGHGWGERARAGLRVRGHRHGRVILSGHRRPSSMIILGIWLAASLLLGAWALAGLMLGEPRRRTRPIPRR
jgi:hypothetical protein